jgi:hypothetical protein
MDSRNHLYFECPVLKRVWKSVMRLCLLEDPMFDWADLEAWGVNHWKGKGLHSTICRLGFGAIVYNI